MGFTSGKLGFDRQGGWNLTVREVGMDFQAMRCVGNINDRFSLEVYVLM